MAPFINGLALGLAGGLAILVFCIALGLAIFILRLGWWLLSYAIPQFAQGLRESGSQFRPALAEGRERAARIREAGRLRREHDLAWMERHWATRWCARLNRRLLG